MQREHGVQSGTGVCQESKTCPYDSQPVPMILWKIIGSQA